MSWGTFYRMEHVVELIARSSDAVLGADVNICSTDADGDGGRAGDGGDTGGAEGRPRDGARAAVRPGAPDPGGGPPPALRRWHWFVRLSTSAIMCGLRIIGGCGARTCAHVQQELVPAASQSPIELACCLLVVLLEFFAIICLPMRAQAPAAMRRRTRAVGVRRWTWRGWPSCRAATSTPTRIPTCRPAPRAPPTRRDAERQNSTPTGTPTWPQLHAYHQKGVALKTWACHMQG